ncbi:MFS transporter [Longispora urticae]
MWEALRYRDFRLSLGGLVLSSLGDWLLVMAAPYFVWHLTGSALATGLTVVAETLPALFVGPVAGVFVDRWSPRSVMIGADVLRAGAMALLLTVRSADLVWLIYLVLALECAVGQFFVPARQKLVPALVGRDSALVSANSLGALARGVVRLVGAPLGGALYVLVGFGWMVAIDVATYLVSAVLIAGIRTPDPVRPPRAEGDVPGRFRAELAAGWRHVRRTAGLPAVFGAAGAFFLGNAVLTALLVPYTSGVLGADSRTLGLLLGALGLGFVVGAPLSRRIVGRFPLRWSLAVSFGTLGVVFLAAFNAPGVVAAGVLFALFGPPAVCAFVEIDTHLQRCTSDEVLGRVSALYLTLQSGAGLIGALGGATLGEALGVQATVDLGAGIVFAGAALALLVPGAAPTPR